jgi:hypothetical protein
LLEGVSRFTIDPVNGSLKSLDRASSGGNEQTSRDDQPNA